MRLTPLDIRKQEFTRGFRGYEAEEVQAFLQMVSSQWEDLLDDQRRQEERLREMEAKLVHYEKVEEALQEALQTARESSRKAVENAEQKARLIIEEAEVRAIEIKKDAEQERHQIKRDAAKLSSRRNEIVARLRAFLMSEMELLARYEVDDPIGFIKLLPADERRLQQAAERTLPPAEPDEPEPSDAAYAASDPDAYDTDEADVDDYEEKTPPSPPAAVAPREAGEGPRLARAPERHAPVYTRPDEDEERPRQARPYEQERAEERRSPRITWKNERPSEPDDEEVYPAEATDASDRPGQAEAEEADAQPDAGERRDEVRRGQGWKAHTVVSPPSGGRGQPSRHGSSDDASITASSEEIEKIRRILNDLD